MAPKDERDRGVLDADKAAVRISQRYLCGLSMLDLHHAGNRNRLHHLRPAGDCYVLHRLLGHQAYNGPARIVPATWRQTLKDATL